MSLTDCYNEFSKSLFSAEAKNNEKNINYLRNFLKNNKSNCTYKTTALEETITNKTEKIKEGIFSNKEYLIVQMPGFKKENIQIEFDKYNRLLTIKAVHQHDYLDLEYNIDEKLYINIDYQIDRIKFINNELIIKFNMNDKEIKENIQKFEIS